MEGKRIISLVHGESIEIETNSYTKENLWKAHVICAQNTCGLAYFEKDIKTIIEHNKGQHYKNFINEFFAKMQIDGAWQSEHFRMVSIILRFNPIELHRRLITIETNQQIFKKDMTSLIKLFLAFNDVDIEGAFEYLQVDMNLWENLSSKYELTKETLNDVAWTFPYLVYTIMCVLSAIHRPINKNLMYKYRNFKPEFGFIGLLGLIPKYGKYGGLIKMLLHYAVLQQMKALNENNNNLNLNNNKTDLILADLLGLARVIFYSNVNDIRTRQEFFTCLGISAADMSQWEKVFDEEFPKFRNIHYKYFSQSL